MLLDKLWFLRCGIGMLNLLFLFNLIYQIEMIPLHYIFLVIYSFKCLSKLNYLFFPFCISANLWNLIVFLSAFLIHCDRLGHLGTMAILAVKTTQISKTVA